MKITYDASTDSLYVDLGEGPAVDAREVEDGVVLDMDADGHIVGIDLQHASERFDVGSVVTEGIALRST